MSRADRILVVDDDGSLLQLLSIRLRRRGYAARTEQTPRAALRAIVEFKPHVVVSDVRMDDIDGFEFLDALRSRCPTLPVIFMTAHGTIPDAVKATRRGAFAYLTKPFDSEELLRTIHEALALHRGSSDAEGRAWGGGAHPQIITRSAVMEAVLDQALRVARTDASVLIQGASGTGKELIARAIHAASPRGNAPFVGVNCTAVPESLFESELFGHRRGAFTGAAANKSGLLEAAAGGTLLLDEIGDMPLGVQGKLLRVLENRLMRPLGATDDVAVDVRVISATNRDLAQLVLQKAFREDLLYRLNVVSIDVPTLAERREDIPALVEHFLSTCLEKHFGEATVVQGFAREALEILITAPWPGNIRQLRNVVEQCAVLCASPLIPTELVERALRYRDRELLGFARARDRFEFDYLVQVLQMTDGNVAQAARLAERSRSEFYKMLRKHRLDPEMFRGDRE